MTIRWWIDGDLRDRFDPHDVSFDETFSEELLAHADGERLIYDGETIRLNVDNGSWLWRVIERDSLARTVRGIWPD